VKIRVIRYGVVHYLAICDQCDFVAGLLTADTPTEAEVRQAVRVHVRQTGHAVRIERASVSVYKPEAR